MGTHCFPIEQESCAQVGEPPVAEYSHDLGCAVIDIGVIRDPALPGSRAPISPVTTPRLRYANARRSRSPVGRRSARRSAP